MHAIFCGSFDPVTNGHVDIAARAARLFPILTVAIGIHPEKSPMFPLDERLGFLKTALASIPNIRVCAFSGLCVDFCRQNHIHAIIRAIRNPQDASCEHALAMTNRALAPDIETVILCAAPELQFLSSSAVKEIASCGRNVDEFVPACVANALRLKMTGRA